MFRRLMFVVMLLLAAVLFATQYTRTITEKIEVYHDGLAIITRQEKISGEDLPKFYADYYKNMTVDQKLFDNFLYEATKEYYFLYGTTPGFSVKDIKFSAVKIFTATIVMKVEGLVGYDKDKNRFVIARKGFGNDGKLVDLLLPKYFESQIEENIFIASFLRSEKNSLVTERTVELILPEGSKLEEISPTFVSKTEPSSWYVDFGAGNTYKANLKKTERGFILKETMVINGGTPKNLLDEKSSESVLDSLRDYTAFQIGFFNDRMKPDSLTKPIEHKVKSDFSGSWTFTASQSAQKTLTFTTATNPSVQLTATPKIETSLTLQVSLLIDHGWVKTGTFRWSWRLRRFEASVSPTVTIKPSLDISVSGTLEKTLSATLFSYKPAPIYFSISFVPVWIQFELAVDAGVYVKFSAGLSFGVSSNYSHNASLRFTYDGRWDYSATRNASHSAPNFSRPSARVAVQEKLSLPFTISAYIYSVAGPFVRLSPWLKAETMLSTANKLDAKLTGGLTLSGGVQMAGWLRSFCDNLPSVEYNIWTWETTLYQGSFTY
ncbi:MAG: hypothetical protein QMC97_04180 [Pseudothermotoga sp.]|uniref:hypothetical protein n=1 Tax=Pseudothermotoga sp. TaxID=2033661 RepID=UPI002586F374|nr:hypothetical protein [Pseudothermotoga sp.]MDI6862562.1 hypothetical protein [Pseudothermotoga sp.]